MPRRKYDGPNRFGGLPPSGERGRKLYVRIAETIGDTLLAGGYSIGDRLPAERDLAQHFGVSRPTMREALLALEVQGLVELRRRTGITVTLNGPRSGFVSDSDKGALDLLQSRRLFEGEVAAAAAINITEASLAELTEALRQLTALPDDDAEAPFRAFHVLLARICANNVITACIENLWSPHHGDPNLRARLDAATRLGRDTWVHTHRQLFEAIGAHGPHAARAAMNTFNDLAIGHLRQVMAAAPLEQPAGLARGEWRAKQVRSSGAHR
jgi:GntR family transcriptional repressor for pyruvate dehydrogenase complex